MVGAFRVHPTHKKGDDQRIKSLLTHDHRNHNPIVYPALTVDDLLVIFDFFHDDPFSVQLNLTPNLRRIGVDTLAACQVSKGEAGGCCFGWSGYPLKHLLRPMFGLLATERRHIRTLLNRQSPVEHHAMEMYHLKSYSLRLRPTHLGQSELKKR